MKWTFSKATSGGNSCVGVKPGLEVECGCVSLLEKHSTGLYSLDYITVYKSPRTLGGCPRKGDRAFNRHFLITEDCKLLQKFPEWKLIHERK